MVIEGDARMVQRKSSIVRVRTLYYRSKAIVVTDGAIIREEVI